MLDPSWLNPRPSNSGASNAQPSLKRQSSTPNTSAPVSRPPAPALGSRRKRNVSLLELRVNNVSVLEGEIIPDHGVETTSFSYRSNNVNSNSNGPSGSRGPAIHESRCVDTGCHADHRSVERRSATIGLRGAQKLRAPIRLGTPSPPEYWVPR